MHSFHDKIMHLGIILRETSASFAVISNPTQDFLCFLEENIFSELKYWYSSTLWVCKRSNIFNCCHPFWLRNTTSLLCSLRHVLWDQQSYMSNHSQKLNRVFFLLLLCAILRYQEPQVDGKKRTISCNINLLPFKVRHLFGQKPDQR